MQHTLMNNDVWVGNDPICDAGYAGESITANKDEAGGIGETRGSGGIWALYTRKIEFSAAQGRIWAEGRADLVPGKRKGSCREGEKEKKKMKMKMMIDVSEAQTSV